MWLQFIAQNLHFAVNLFAALVCAGIAWLYLDAWMAHKDKKQVFRWSGFGILALSFLAQATVIEQSVLGSSLIGDFAGGLIVVLRLVGLGLIIAGEIADPLQKKPSTEGLKLSELHDKKDPTPKLSVPEKRAANPPIGGAPDATDAQEIKVYGGVAPGAGVAAKWLLPFAAFAAAALYWRRATTGLERHLKRVAYGFALFGLADLIGLASLLRDTDNPTLYSWVAAFGWVWLLGQVVLLAGALVLGIWVWGYLTKRFFSQLFIVLTVTTVIVFLVVTVGFTALLLKNIRNDALTNLSTAASVLDYALQSQQTKTMNIAQQVARDTDIVAAVQAKDSTKLVGLAEQQLVQREQSSLIIVDSSSQVLARGEEPDQRGDSLSSDSLVRRALFGEEQSSLVARPGAGTPTIQIRSAAMIKSANGTTIGVVIAGLDLGSAFADGLQQATGLQSSIYAGSTLAATTLVNPDGKTRNTGTTLANTAVTDRVLKQGQPYSGTVSIQNRELLAVFRPLKDVDNNVPGMLLVSQPESHVLEIAGRSIELTFMLAALLLLIGIVPIYFVARVIERQME